MMEIKKLQEFEKEFKHLCKKYSSLENDFIDFQETLEVYLKEDFKKNEELWMLWERIANLWKDVDWNFFKFKKFMCFSIARQSKNSWIRIIYCYSEESEELEFIEIYHKNQKENHDIERIKQNYWV